MVKIKFETVIVKQDTTKDYMDVTWASLEKYPEDYLMQLKYVKENGTEQHYALWMIDRLQYLSNLKSQRKIEVSYADIDLVCRSFMDALRHMQPNLPEGVYCYIVSNMEYSILNVVSTLNGLSKNQ